MSGQINRVIAVFVGAVFLIGVVFMPSAQGQEICFEDVLEEVIVTEQIGEYVITSTVVGTIPVVVPCPEDDDDEVLGITETPEEVLALTGNEVSVPAAIGFTLIGTGGLALYAGRRRQEREES